MTHAIDGVPVVTYDLEVFPNYFLATFLVGTQVRVYEYCKQSPDGLRKLADTFAPGVYLCGYNNFGYDDLILGHVLAHPTVSTQDIYNLSKKIIGSRHEDESIFKMTYARRPWAGSVDMFQILNGKSSLKELICREGYDHVVESAHAFDEDLPPADFAAIRAYCLNDTKATARLMASYWHLIELRTKLDRDYRLGRSVYVKSEPGLAQMTFVTLHRRRVPQSMQQLRQAAETSPENTQRWMPLKSIISPRVSFSLQKHKEWLHALASTTVQAKDKLGMRWTLPKAYDTPITFGNGGRYKMGVGGLHSVDGPGRWGEADNVWDVDLVSAYPSIIIEEKYFPKHLGPGFVDDMRAMRDRRVALKKSGDKAGADALKIVINSAFGKLQQVHSPLRSIPSALRVTINGQLLLLMLIETLEASGIKILSANTDGVTVQAYAQHAVTNAMEIWSKKTGHQLELTRFLRYCRRDVNCYSALREDGTCKSKGAMELTPNTYGSKWDNIISKKAAQDFLLKDVPIRKTVESCTNMREFLFYARIKNGGTVRARGLHASARSVRWYAATRGHAVKRRNPKGTFAILPNGHRARLAMDIEHCDILGLDFLDYQYYITAAQKLADATKAQT